MQDCLGLANPGEASRCGREQKNPLLTFIKPGDAKPSRQSRDMPAAQPRKREKKETPDAHHVIEVATGYAGR
jgi:hypothetical protein